MDATLIGQDSSSPYDSFSFDNTKIANGDHMISAKAYDVAGNVGSKTISVKINNPTIIPDTSPPTVSILNPANGATVSSVVSVIGKASDNISVTKVEVSIDGGFYQSASGTTDWGFPLNTISLSNGVHNIGARSVDSSGNVSSTASINVTVSNSVSGSNGCLDGKSSIKVISGAQTSTFSDSAVPSQKGYDARTASWY